MKRFVVPLIAFFSSIALICLILLFSSSNPAASLSAFFTGPFSSLWHAGVLLNRTALLIIAATGASLAFKSGSFNLGGEAQIYAPALLTAIILIPTDFSGPPWVRPLLAFLAAVALGALLGGIPGVLKSFRGTSELLTSFLLSAALIPVIDYLISGPLRDSTKSLLATPAIDPASRLPVVISSASITIALPFALIIALAAAFFLQRTGLGFRFRTTGIAPEFSRYSGFNTRSIPIAGMALSGALHGAAGYAAITGTWFMCHTGLTAGMGWSALAIALIARSNPLAVIPAACLYAWIETASETALLSTRFSFDSSALVQGLIFLVVAARTCRLPAIFTRIKRTQGASQ